MSNIDYDALLRQVLSTPEYQNYQQISNEPLIFQKGANTLSISTKNNKVSSITLDGFASVNDSFVSDEKSRIEKALGKTAQLFSKQVIGFVLWKAKLMSISWNLR